MSTPSAPRRRHIARTLPYPASGGAYRVKLGRLVADADEAIPDPIRPPPGQPRSKGGTAIPTKE